jgi:hypothetical protein
MESEHSQEMVAAPNQDILQMMDMIIKKLQVPNNNQITKKPEI